MIYRSFSEKQMKIKHIGSLYLLMIARARGEISNYVSYHTLSFILGVEGLEKNPREAKCRIRKALKELQNKWKSLDYKEDLEKGIKFTYIPLVDIIQSKHRKGETKGFTQLYCDLVFIDGITADLIVLHTALEYFKGASKEVSPSIDTLATMCGCSRRKMINLIKEGKDLGLWKVEGTKGGTKKHTNKYILSYIDEEGKEVYFFRNKVNETDNMEEIKQA